MTTEAGGDSDEVEVWSLRFQQPSGVAFDLFLMFNVGVTVTTMDRRFMNKYAYRAEAKKKGGGTREGFKFIQLHRL